MEQELLRSPRRPAERKARLSGSRSGGEGDRSPQAGGDVRRRVVAVIGQSDAPSAALAVAEELGRRIVEAGYRLVTGGLGGVMEAASQGAHSASGYREGDVIGILPDPHASSANEHVDIAIPTGMGIARNVLVVATADAVVAVGGGSGTLSEIALAWQLGKPVVALEMEGWSGRLAGEAIDSRRSDRILRARSAEEATGLVAGALAG